LDQLINYFWPGKTDKKVLKMFLRVLLLVLVCLAISSGSDAQNLLSSDSRLLASLQTSNFNEREKRSPEPQWGYNSRPYYNSYPGNNYYYYGSGRGFGGNGNFRRGLATAALVGAAAVGGGLIGAGLARG
jgi:hypothetical protein